jgi:hypothetical protein
MVIGFHLLPRTTQELLENKMTEKITPEGVFAELGMKAAIAATQYNKFDPDGNQRIERHDIARVFATVEGVTAEQAYAIANTIMMEADTDFISKRAPEQLVKQFVRKVFCGCRKASLKALRESAGEFRETDLGDLYSKKEGADASDEGLSFSEFVTCLEGRALDFETLKEKMKLPREVKTEELDMIKAHLKSKGIDPSTGVKAKASPRPDKGGAQPSRPLLGSHRELPEGAGVSLQSPLAA